MKRKVDLSEMGKWLCGACSKASEKDGWEKYDELVDICPECGALVVLSRVNVIPPVPEPEPEAKKAAKK